MKSTLFHVRRLLTFIHSSCNWKQRKVNHLWKLLQIVERVIEIMSHRRQRVKIEGTLKKSRGLY